jgi:uncharacterized protein with LGFP repeats
VIFSEKEEKIDKINNKRKKPTEENKNLAENKLKQIERKSTGKKALPQLNVEFKMSDFNNAEIENPDVLDNLISIQVLNFKIEKVQNEINKIDGRAPPSLREKILKMKVKKNVKLFLN